LEDYKKKLLLEKRSNASVREAINYVKTWLKINGVKLDLSNFTLPKAKTREKDEPPSEEQLRLIMSKATLRMKVAIAILISSGIRVGALLGLKLKDIALDYDASTGISKIVVPEELSKNGFSYTTFMSSEATKLLKEYLEYRKKKRGEELTPESYLIAGKGGRPLKYDTFRTIYRRLLERCGLAKKSHKHHVYHIHVLRKFFRTKTEKLTPSIRERLMGHIGGYLDESYFRITEVELLEEYKKVHASLLLEEGIAETLKKIKKDESFRNAIVEVLFHEVFPNESKTGQKQFNNELVRNPENALKLVLSKLGKRPEEASQLVLSWIKKES